MRHDGNNTAALSTVQDGWWFRYHWRHLPRMASWASRRRQPRCQGLAGIACCCRHIAAGIAGAAGRRHNYAVVPRLARSSLQHVRLGCEKGRREKKKAPVESHAERGGTKDGNAAQAEMGISCMSKWQRLKLESASDLLEHHMYKCYDIILPTQARVTGTRCHGVSTAEGLQQGQGLFTTD